MVPDKLTLGGYLMGSIFWTIFWTVCLLMAFSAHVQTHAQTVWTTAELQQMIIGDSSNDRRCFGCHGENAITTKLVNVEQIESVSWDLCDSVKSGRMPIGDHSKYEEWPASERELFDGWCRKNLGKPADPPNSGEAIQQIVNKIYSSRCLFCHPGGDPWTYPPLFCQTVFNGSMPWNDVTVNGQTVKAKLFGKWSDSERRTFTKWCQQSVQKTRWKSLQIPVSGGEAIR